VVAKKYLLFLILSIALLATGLQVFAPAAKNVAENQASASSEVNAATMRQDAMPDIVVVQAGIGILINGLQKNAIRVFVLAAIFFAAASIIKARLFYTRANIFSRYLYCIFPFHSFW
jgi:hypothetical protein